VYTDFMAVLNIGSLIKRLRTQQGMTQEELALPIIEQATLSRIESGQTMPNKRTIEMLLEKLGYNPNNIDIFIDNKAENIQKKMDELESLLKTESVYDDQDERNKKADVIIKNLESDKEFMAERLNRQYILTFKAMIAWFKKKDSNLVHGMFMEAMKASIPEYNENDIDKYYLSKQDLRIINFTSLIYRDNGRLDDSIKILSLLKKNFDELCIDKAARGEYYISVIYNLAQMLAYAERYEEALKMCDRAAEVCRDTGSFRLLPLITSYKVRCLYHLGDKDECPKLLKQAFYASEMFGQYKWKEMLRKYAKENFDMEL